MQKEIPTPHFSSLCNPASDLTIRAKLQFQPRSRVRVKLWSFKAPYGLQLLSHRGSTYDSPFLANQRPRFCETRTYTSSPSEEFDLYPQFLQFQSNNIWFQFLYFYFLCFSQLFIFYFYYFFGCNNFVLPEFNSVVKIHYALLFTVSCAINQSRARFHSFSTTR